FGGNITGGNFTLTYGSNPPQTVPYANTVAGVQGNIQTALNNMFGAGNTQVIANSSGTNEVETLTLGGTASGTFTPSYNGVAGTSLTVTDETQTLTLVANGTTTLSFNGNAAPAPLT